MEKPKGLKIKELLKNKKFLIAMGVVALIALVMYFNKNKTATTETEQQLSEEEGSYGSGGSAGSYYPSTQQEPLIDDIAYDNGYDDIIVNQTQVVDDNVRKQEISNKIYDLKDLWDQTNKEFMADNIKSQEERDILGKIHEEAVNIGLEGGFLDTSKDSSGNYSGLLGDTRKYNALTGESTTPGVEGVVTDEIKSKRLEAQKSIDLLKEQYTLTTDKAKQREIHKQAEVIGIKAGLGSGGAEGKTRKKVNEKGEVIG
jgi:hypothetical protein